ncbi:MAG: hypothetical protein KR126chlam3_00199 [Chlamydiae bacterium]|nr:hypothetical protein [Chlamydiota bacterium]
MRTNLIKILVLFYLLALTLAPCFSQEETEFLQTPINHSKIEGGQDKLEKPSHVENSTENKISDMESSEPSEEESSVKIIRWLSKFHPISSHFPIVLIIMAGIAELLFFLAPSPTYSYSSRFMIIAGAISAIPVILLGLAYGIEFESNSSSLTLEIFWWHRFCGISTGILACTTATMKELNFRKILVNSHWYLISLCITIIFVLITAYLGG